MTTAVSEILQQVEFLSPAEQLELTARLAERARQNAAAVPHNGHPREPVGAEPPSADTEERAGEDAEEENWLDTLDLKLMPLNRTFTARVRFRAVGRLQPLPYDLSDFFDEEAEEG